MMEGNNVPPIAPSSILGALVSTVLVVDPDNRLAMVNASGENFLGGSAETLCGRKLNSMIPDDSPLFDALDRVRKGATRTSEYGIHLDSPVIGRHEVNIHAAPLHDHPGHVVLSLHQRSISEHLDLGMAHRGAARSLTGMAAMLAHEVKNPLSGIRGAAQLLDVEADEDNRKLTRLICDETDRIVALVERMEAFSHTPIQETEAVNIHRVLERVRRLAENGFAAHARITEDYDPSLPAVRGHHDSLVRLFLNLVKNAAEALPERDGTIALRTSFRGGVRFSVAGASQRAQLPLVIEVCDNGRGIANDLLPHLFDAFVTTKPNGSGLGLAMVAKIVEDSGGSIEVDSTPGRTVFRVRLPMADPEAEITP